MQQKYRHCKKCITSQIWISPPTKSKKRYIYIYIKGSHLYLLVQITEKWSPIRQKYRHSQKCITSQIRISPPQLQTRKKRYIKKRAATFISLYKSQKSIGNLNDYCWNAIATMVNLRVHWPYKKHLTLKNITTRYQQQIFQPTRKAILLLCLILNM